jgi:hypothetical protein
MPFSAGLPLTASVGRDPASLRLVLGKSKEGSFKCEETAVTQH